MRKKLAVTTAAAAAAAALTLSSAAYACTIFRGHGDLVGNASTVHSTAEGNNASMAYCGTVNPGAQAHGATAGSVTIVMTTATCNASHLDPNTVYHIRYFNGVGFKNNRKGVFTWFTDCMSGSSGTELTTKTSDANGGLTVTGLNIGTGANNATGQDSAVCISDGTGSIGIELPVHIVT